MGAVRMLHKHDDEQMMMNKNSGQCKEEYNFDLLFDLICNSNI